jgi:hypothetical protein
MISKQTKLLALIGIVCLASALIWQNYSHVVFELTHSRVEVSTGPAGSGTWDLGSLHEHHPAGSNVLFLVGVFALLFTVPSLVGDIRRLRQHR